MDPNVGYCVNSTYTLIYSGFWPEMRCLCFGSVCSVAIQMLVCWSFYFVLKSLKSSFTDEKLHFRTKVYLKKSFVMIFKMWAFLGLNNI